MKKLVFVKHPYIGILVNGARWSRNAPRLCAGPTARVFNLGRGRTRVTVILTKTQPRKPGKFFELVVNKHWLVDTGLSVWPKGYRGSLFPQSVVALKKYYDEGYRYVRVE